MTYGIYARDYDRVNSQIVPLQNPRGIHVVLNSQEDYVLHRLTIIVRH
jgi:hypothetical protein